MNNDKIIKKYVTLLKEGSAAIKYDILKENPDYEFIYQQAVIDICNAILRALEQPKNLSKKPKNNRGMYR